MRTSLLREASVLAVLSAQACALPSGDMPSGTPDDAVDTNQSPFTAAPFVGTFNGGNWLLDASGNHAFDLADRAGSFGVAGDLPFVYHRLFAFSGLGGIFRNGLWCFDWNDSIWWDGGDTCSHHFGQAGDRPVVGRWFPQCFTNECIGVFRNGSWYLDTGDKSWQTGFDVLVSYGPSNALPVVGSWRRTHYTNIGSFLNGAWVLDTNGNMVEEASDKHGNFGIPGDIPIAGDWDGDGIDNVGIFRPSSSTFCLDMNGDVNWDGGDVCFPYGTQTGSLPVVRGQATAPTASIPGPMVVACRYSDLTRGNDFDLEIAGDEFTIAGQGKGGMYDYLKKVTYGKINLEFSSVNGWYTMSQTISQAAGQPRAVRAQWCRDAATAQGLNLGASARHLFLLTDEQDDSNFGLDSVLNYRNWRINRDMTHAAHEILHQYGLQHSWGFGTAPASEYGDPVDIMSAHMFGGVSPSPIYTGSHFGIGGPSLNAAYRLKFFDPMADDPSVLWEASLTLGGVVRHATVDLVALDHPEVAGTLMVRLLNNPPTSDFYTVEFREKSGLDRAIQQHRVVVRRWNDSLQGTQRETDLPAGGAWSRTNPTITVTVNWIDTARHVANVSMTY